jgi:hypothetical protein
MKTHRLIPVLALAVLAAVTMGSGCPTFPKLEDRVVEVAAGGSVTQEFVAEGIVNTFSDDAAVDLAGQVDLSKIADDAGLEPGDITGLTLVGVSYRVTVPDPNAGRTISGNVKFNGQPLITGFSQNVDAASDWTKATLDPAGVTAVNGVLTQILDQVNGGASGPINVTYHVDGTSSPTDATTSFTWQLKLDLSVKGKLKKIKVLS